jgi:hypothetical protein
MKYLIILSMLAICACTNDTRDAQNTGKDENPSLHTIGHIGNVKIQVGLAEIKE